MASIFSLALTMCLVSLKAEKDHTECRENNAEDKDVCETGSKACPDIIPFLLRTTNFKKI